MLGGYTIVHIREKFVGSVGGPKLQLWKHRWLMILAVCFVLLFPSQVVLADKSDDLQTVYHVYMDDKHIGAVGDKDSVEEIIEKKIEENQSKYSTLKLTADEKITYVEEKTFHPEYSEEKVKDKLTEDLEIKADAYVLKIDDEVVGYFKDKSTVSELLKAYQMDYVGDKEFNKLDKQTDDTYKLNTDEAEKELEPGDSRVTKVSLSEDVAISKEPVSPDKVLTKKKGKKLLKKGTLEDEVHHVEEGDVIESIAEKYDLTTEEILDLNEELTEDSVLQIDQEIHVTALQPFMDVVVDKEKVVKKKISFEKEVEETDDLYEGEKEVTQKGKDGKEEVHYAINEENGERVTEKVTDRNVVKKPVKKIVRIGTKVIPSRGTGDLSWPVDGGHISSHVGTRWGSMHKGIDIAGPHTKTITAADNGVVTEAGYNSGGYGNKIVINHNNGMKTVYAHLSSIDVDVGQTVEQGHSIGVMGSTGNSTGLHLHFEVYKNGNLEKPTEYVHP